MKAIILDFDGVVLESVDVKTQAFAELFSAHTDNIEPIVRYHLNNNGVSRFKKFEYIWKNLLKREYNDSIKEELGKKFSNIVKAKVIECPFVNGGLEFLEKFYDKFPIYVASAVPQEELAEIIKKRGINKYFAKIYGYPPSTKTEAIIDIMDRHHITAADILYIGDSREDLRASGSVGTMFIARQNKESFEGFSGPVFKDMSEIADYVGGISKDMV